MSLSLLENLTSPGQLSDMSDTELKELADELRHALLMGVSSTGGHLASNLGVVELTIALHRVFNSPVDQIVFDVGHQCYVHKMLTGRFDRFSTLRQEEGLSGFPNPEESEHDIFKTGHSSTSISSALGLAYAKRLSGDDSSVVAVIGDGSMTGGMAYEGLNNAGNSGCNLVVVLNDNNMSISKNVGAISKAITRMRNRSSYFRFKDGFENFLMHLPLVGKPMYSGLVRLKSAVKTLFYSSNIFESMGFKYIGPVDGHNIELLSRVLERAKSLKCPVLVHVKTKKGKGYQFAENKPREFHGVGEFDVGTGNSNPNTQLSFTDVFGRAILRLAEKDKRICAITAAMGESCGLSQFKAQFPERFFDVGIAEQHAVTFAGGLAKNGYLPVFAVYSSFFQRSFDQVIHDVSLQNLKVVFAVDRAGIVGDDGETHQGMFDIPMLLPIPNVLIFSPSTGTELEKMLTRAVELEKLSCAVRYPRGGCISYTEFPFKNPSSDWDFSGDGANTAVISYGRLIHDVLPAAADFGADVIKLNLINRFESSLLDRLMGYEKLLFAEECYRIGGIGELLASALISRGYKGVYKIAAADNEFIKHSPLPSVKARLGLDSASIKRELMRL